MATFEITLALLLVVAQLGVLARAGIRAIDTHAP